MSVSIRAGLFWSAIFIGMIAFSVGLTLPVYADHAKASQLKLNACGPNGVLDGWYDQLGAIETLRHPLMQGGLSLVLAAITIALLTHLFGEKDGRSIGSPTSRKTFLFWESAYSLSAGFRSWSA